MLAGLARLIEICFIIPAHDTHGTSPVSDQSSERTVAVGISPLEMKLTAAQAFRHLPPFVSRNLIHSYTLLTYDVVSQLLVSAGCVAYCYYEAMD